MEQAGGQADLQHPEGADEGVHHRCESQSRQQPGSQEERGGWYPRVRIDWRSGDFPTCCNSVMFRLGAPGTAPPKQLVQRYAGMSVTGLPQLGPVHRHLSLRSTVEQLQDICLSQGWGEPLYSLVPGDGGDDGSKTGGQFCYKVSLPNFPLPAPHNTFQSSGWKLTAGET